tara:strand:- start:209 stop:376 length:168 start_codon:yes stop_codon:yes gene_type:complete
MGRPKKELKKIHRKNIKKAKAKVRLLKKGEITHKDLTERGKHFLKKGKKKKLSLA